MLLLLLRYCVMCCVQNMAKRDHAKRMQSMREWTDDELRMLDKAVKKFPMGTPKRWEQVCKHWVGTHVCLYLRGGGCDNMCVLVRMAGIVGP